MATKVPKTTAFYCSSKTEPQNLLCWIPPNELESMAEQGKAPKDILQYYPDGLEIEVSESALTEGNIDLGIEPKFLCAAYLKLYAEQKLPSSGLIGGDILFQDAKMLLHGTGGTSAMFALGEGTATKQDATGKYEEPLMTEGEEPEEVFKRLAARGDNS